MSLFADDGRRDWPRPETLHDTVASTSDLERRVRALEEALGKPATPAPFGPWQTGDGWKELPRWSTVLVVDTEGDATFAQVSRWGISHEPTLKHADQVIDDGCIRWWCVLNTPKPEEEGA